MRKVGGSFLAIATIVVALLAPLRPSANAWAASRSVETTGATLSADSTFDACLHYSGHVYEVCTAYIANSSLAVLLPYYKYSHSIDNFLAPFVTYRLSSRYTGQAYQTIVARVATWPAGTLDVSLPTIRILSVQSNLQTDTARLVSQESWEVTTENGHTVYRESNQRHNVTMRRVPSYLLHKWVVTSLQ